RLRPETDTWLPTRPGRVRRAGHQRAILVDLDGPIRDLSSQHIAIDGLSDHHSVNQRRVVAQLAIPTHDAYVPFVGPSHFILACIALGNLKALPQLNLAID